MKNNNFFYSLIDGSTDIKIMDGMAPGKFQDMMGRWLEIKKDELPEYIKNTQNALASTVDANGELVGFPIDGMGHNHEEAVGWIKAVSLSENKAVVQLEVEWNEDGKELISSKKMRYFSPEIDLQQKVILGGSLTNWPATITPKHEFLLKPITLQLYSLSDVSYDSIMDTVRDQFMNIYQDWDYTTYPVETFEEYIICRREDKYWKVNYSMSDDGTVTFDPMESWKEVKKTWIEATLEMLKRVLSGISPVNSQLEDDMDFDLTKATPEQKAALLSQARSEVIAEMQGTPPAELATLIQTRADEIAASALAVEKRKSHVAEFCARVVGGTTEAPKGLPVTKDALESLLLSLPEEKQSEVEAMFSDILSKGITPFDELGHSKVVNGNRELSAEMKPILEKALANGMKLSEFFKANAVELGDMSEYNLAEYQEK